MIQDLGGADFPDGKHHFRPLVQAVECGYGDEALSRWRKGVKQMNQSRKA